uniref:Gustatory receptor n=1 Tax=Phlebotomus papatasi TaxID=29031 RepID=A0A3F2ZEG0_PHLPP
MDLIRIFNFHLTFFRIFGICIQTPGMSRRTKILACSSAIISVIFVSILFPISYIVIKPTKANAFINFIQGVGLMSIHLATSIETLFTRNQQIRFWNCLKKIEKLYPHNFEEIQNKYQALKRTTEKNFWIFVITSIIIEVVFSYFMFSSNDLKADWLKNAAIAWAMYIISVLIGRIRYLSHFFVVGILKIHLELFNNSILSLKRNLRLTQTDQIVHELNRIKFRHNFIWEMSMNINICHQWSQFINVLVNFLQITSLCYYIYYFIVNNSFIRIIPLSVCYTLLIWNIYTLAKLGDDVQKAGIKSATLLHEILKINQDHLENKFLNNCIVNLSLQIHHEKIIVTFGKIFTLNNGFLAKLTATIATYIVILIQILV